MTQTDETTREDAPRDLTGELLDRAAHLLNDLAKAHNNPGLVGALIKDALNDEHGPIVLAASLHSLFGSLVTEDRYRPGTYRI